MPEETNQQNVTFSVPLINSNIFCWIAFFIMLSAKVFNFAPNLSWWIVTCPLWGFFGLFIAVIGVILAFCCVLLLLVFCWWLITTPFIYLYNLIKGKKK